jgi:phosphonoacetaldehyde hydrolase
MSEQSDHRIRASPVRAIITDWAGTIVDFGSRAPVAAVMKVFAVAGISITNEEARAPMGRAKRDHLAAVARMDRVTRAWRDRFSKDPSDADIDRLYAAFLPIQKSVLADMSRPIPGVAKTLAALRTRGLKIASTTGYTRELMSVVTAVAGAEGIEVDAVVTVDDVSAGRPAPWAIFRAAESIGVFPMSSVVVVDDTPVGIQAARNTGAWAVAVARTGNQLGLSEDQAAALPPDKWKNRRREIEAEFKACGADFVIDSFADLPSVVDEIDERLISHCPGR